MTATQNNTIEAYETNATPVNVQQGIQQIDSHLHHKYLHSQDVELPAGSVLVATDEDGDTDYVILSESGVEALMATNDEFASDFENFGDTSNDIEVTTFYEGYLVDRYVFHSAATS